MASVRLTQALSKEILDEVDKLYQESFNEAEASLAPDFNRRAQEIWWSTVLADGKRQVFAAMPDNWKKQAERFAIQGAVDLAWVCEASAFTYVGEFTPKKAAVPVCYEHYYYGNPSEVHLPKNHPLMIEFAAWESRKQEVVRARHEFKEKVKAVLETVTTLNQFVKVWPAGAKLVPPEFLQKMAVKTPRSRVQAIKEEIKTEAGVDVDTLNQELLKKVIGA